MNDLIGCCGLDCKTCDARIATLTNDNTLREKTAVLWTRLNGVTITPEMINCTGCRVAGAKTPFCENSAPYITASGKRDWIPVPTASRWIAVQCWGKSP